MRTTDRVLALVLGLALFALGCLVVAEVGYAALGNSGPLLLPYPDVADFLRRTPWTSGWIVAGAAVLAVLGLVLFGSEVRRRRPGLLAMRSDDPNVVAAVSRKSVVRAMQTAVNDAAGIERSTVRVGARKIRVRASARSGAPADVDADATQHAGSALSGLALQREPKLSVTVTGGPS